MVVNMSGLRMRFSGTVLSPVRFGNQSPEDPAVGLKASRETIGHAKLVKTEQLISSENDLERPDVKADREVSTRRWDLFGSFFSGQECPAGILAALGAGAMAFCSYGYKTNDAILQPSEFLAKGYTLEDMESAQARKGASNFFWYPAALVTLIFGLGTVGLVAESTWQLRAALKKAREIKNQLLLTREEPDEDGKRLTQLLERWTTQEAEAFSRQIATTYESEPEVRPHLDAVFGGQKGLPTAVDLMTLFAYFAYQDFKSQPGAVAVSNSSPESIQTVSRLELQKRVYVLLQAGVQMGELFQFVEPDQKGIFEETFSRTMGWKVETLEQQISGKLEMVKSLLGRQVETEKHIRMAQKALLNARLSKNAGEEKALEIKTLIQQFKDLQTRTEKALDNLKTASALEDASLKLLNEEFTQLVDYLKLVLKAEKLLESSPPETGLMTAPLLSMEKPENLHAQAILEGKGLS